MRPVLQAIPGPDGDCFAACVASLLEVELAELPDLIGDRWASVLRRWLAARGRRVDFRPGDGQPLTDQADPPPGHAIVGQRVLDGSVHAVVCHAGRIVHDPSPRPIGHPCWPVVLWTVIGERKTMIPENDLIARAAAIKARDTTPESDRLVAFFGDRDLVFVGEDATRALAALRKIPGLYISGYPRAGDTMCLPLKLKWWGAYLRMLDAAGLSVIAAPLNDPEYYYTEVP